MEEFENKNDRTSAKEIIGDTHKNEKIFLGQRSEELTSLECL